MYLRCPKCGYELSPKNYTIESRKLLENYSKPLRDTLKSLHKKITSAMPSQGVSDLYFFLLKITYEKINEQLLRKMVDQYIYYEYYKQGKGYSYLSAMIINKSKDNENLIKFERQRIGSIPPIREIK